MRADREHREQVAFFKWLKIQHSTVYDMAFAVPNGGLRSKATAGKLKAEGVKPGVPDVAIMWPSNGHHGLFIEMKAKGKPQSSVTPKQREWISKLNACGYKARWAPGWEEAARIVEEYLEADDRV